MTATGLSEAQIRATGERLLKSKATVVCWAMGLTQHKHSVAMLRDVVNVLLLQGNIGKPGAGVCPVRGHSNVQGDRTMGIFERMPSDFHDALDREFSFASPRPDGFDTVAAIVFMGMGGNFVRATPDSDVTEAALKKLSLTVQISTKLNKSHLITGRQALILPTLGRTERDTQAGGDQRVTVEDSMSAVHASRGRLAPASANLLSEVAIVCRLAKLLVEAGDGGASRPREAWTALMESSTGLAHFTANELEYPRVPEGRLLLQTLRSHDQYNTTIYGKDDRYRGIKNGRRVVFVNQKDLDSLGIADGTMVDLVSEWKDGVDRRAPEFRVVAYSTPVGCAAAYYPETNVLVPLDSKADVSGTPTSKSVVIRLEPR